MKKILLIIGCILLGIACGKSYNKEKDLEERLKEVNAEYLQEIKDINILPEMLSHFPHQLEFLPVGRVKNYAIKNKCTSYMLFEYGVSSLYTDSISELCKKKSIQIRASSDSTLVAVKSELEVELYGKPALYKKIGGLSFFPVPFFEKKSYDNPEDIVTTEDVYSDSTICGLSQDFIIYVLDAKPGNYWEGLPPLDYMPEGWKNGFSRGICINEKKGIVIYWVIIW